MQILVDDEILLIDPLAKADLTGLWAALLETPVVLHSGRQDLEVINITAERLPTQVYDTQIAAGLVGMPAQIGYANLVSSICDVALDKAHTRTDWSRRPLADEVLDYAADDVRYLPAATEFLEDKLKSLGRLEWVNEDSAALCDPDLYTLNTASAWQRVRGIGRLPEIIQQRICALADWREQMAQRRNRPRQWIARDELLINIAFANPQTIEAFVECDGVTAKFAEHNARMLVALLDATLPPVPVFSGRPDDAERRRVKAMAKAVRAIAAELEIEAEILAPQRELKQAARGEQDLRAFRGWRNGVVGAALRELMP